MGKHLYNMVYTSLSLTFTSLSMDILIVSGVNIWCVHDSPGIIMHNFLLLLATFAKKLRGCIDASLKKTAGY